MELSLSVGKECFVELQCIAEDLASYREGLYEVSYKLLVLLAACACRCSTAIRRHRLFTTTGDTLPLVQGGVEG